ncbi:DUF4190 domain-containing protein [Agrococcus sp. HG114]|uniref:DUF4190 domain-containing protein n=1 Tax=Agrococcus sp. HG114 TaxID=2969757 RepID=UPI00215B21F2|nr:DUF4190 domain-containing protein [Agrococcus sp. HG114]MCR8670544.1 DUF4190 domain-containing protein [Agrococcus sp. HG114]
MTDSPSPARSQPFSGGDATQPAGSYAYGAAQPKTLSIVSLVLGLASIFIGGSILVPIAGIIVGVMARKREPAGRTMALWGIWLSVAMLVLWALLWILAGGLLLAAIGLASSGA